MDCTYYALRALAAVGLIWDLRSVPDHIRKQWRGDDLARRNESPGCPF
jgi:hypothetical protein